MDRRLMEIELLRQRYGELEHGPQVEWLVFKAFPLPQGWNRNTTRLLINVPPGYPVTPPDNFYVETGLRLTSGATPGSYSESVQHLGQSWGQFSHHGEPGEWKPSADILSGHNLLTFMLSVEKRLGELN